MLKKSENPPISWPEAVSIRDFAGHWWIAHTKSRNEKALANSLVSKEISYFLPMNWNVRRQKGRTIRSLLPLFPGYLFFNGDENARLEVLRTNRVANILMVEDQERLVGELFQIEVALKSGAELKPHKYIDVGQTCRVKAGPLADIEGIVIQTHGHAKLVLKVDMLGQAASVEIETDMIEVVENQPEKS